MAGVVNTARLSARLASRYVPRQASRRAFGASAQDHAAQNFTMPALSPTMTEGKIAKWQVKEGDSYSAGDVLLEIETDKATMDVEAQDDGILVKVFQQEGSKGVKVGERIAVTAEPGDDASNVEIPAKDTREDAKEETRSSGDEKSAESSEKIAQAPSPPKPRADAKAEQKAQGGKAQKQIYPLYPSVEHLLHENGLINEDADKIPASGPKGRLLKGDVLAYLGRISKEYPTESSARLDKLSHLDLSNIQLAKPAPTPEAAKAVEAVAPEIPQETEFAVPISLSAVVATQKRVQNSLGIFLPLSTFIARASELANEDLPANKAKPTADDLFNSVLGLDKITKFSRGNFMPEITGLSPAPSSASARSSKKSDIIDILASKPSKKPAPAIPTPFGVSSGANVLSVTAKPGDEGRAVEYLERMKLALETEPGRLVL